jgi:hypothetical protein
MWRVKSQGLTPLLTLRARASNLSASAEEDEMATRIETPLISRARHHA